MTDSNREQAITITEDRIHHMLQVARRAYELSITLFGWSEEKAKQMFTMGLLHDIGYEFVPDQLQHAHVGGELLRDIGYRYWQEVYHHGDPNSFFKSDELTVLNLADMQTSPKGALITLDERLSDIAERYGETSQQFILAKRVIDSIKQELDQSKIEDDSPSNVEWVTILPIVSEMCIISESTT